MGLFKSLWEVASTKKCPWCGKEFKDGGISMPYGGDVCSRKCAAEMKAADK